MSGPIGPAGAAYFEREYFELHPGKRRYLRYLSALLQDHGISAGRLLDVGSGYGFWLEELRRSGHRGLGLELAPEAARRGAGRVAVANAETALPVLSESMDAVTVLDVIEHVRVWRALLAECARVLRPGGLLMVITLNAGSVARPLLGRRWSFHLDPTHVQMFSASLLRDEIACAGLTVERLTTMSNFCCVGESNRLLRPLRAIGRVVETPWLGDSLLAIARRPPLTAGATGAR